LFVLIVALFLVVNCSACPKKFEQFTQKYGKTYSSVSETVERYLIFAENLAKTEEWNKIEGKEVFGVTKFSDLTQEEFKKTHLNYKPNPQIKGRYLNPSTLSNVEIPASVDWRNQGAVSPVYNQEQCGSCWAFSATEEIESMWYLTKNTSAPPTLSMQQIVDCDTVDEGCNGGDTPTAYAYVMKAGGLESFNQYPYTGVDGTCDFVKADIVASMTNWEYVTQAPQSNETLEMIALANIGPLSICVDAATWQYYTGDIIHHLCGNTLDHCVQLVGYATTTAGEDYWIVRNSWGTDWGLDGYLYIERGKDLCGIADEVTYVIIN